ncbi:outer membrane protein assembly factor BamD, partial [bacterium]
DVLLLGKAILMAQTQRFGEAKDIYSELLTTSDDQLVLLQAYIGKADAFYNLAEYKEAITIYREALDKTSQSAPQEVIDKLHYGFAWALLKEGEFKEAIDEFQKIAKYTEDKIIKVSVLCQIGDTYQDSGDYIKAAEAYDTILKDYPDSLYSDYVQYQLGITLLRQAKYDGAILAFQSLKSKFPDSKLLDDASYALGLSYFQREDYNASKEIFEKFSQEHKDSILVQQAAYLLGTSLYNLGKFSEAIEVFKNIVRIYGQDAELTQKAEYEIADCYYQLGNEQEALNRFKALRAKYPDSRLTPEVVWWLGEYYYRRNELDLARRYFSSLIQDFPKSSLTISAYYAVGSTYAEESNYEAAINNFQKVIELDKKDLGGQAAVAIGDLYIKQEKPDLALEAYNDAVEEHQNLAGLIYPKIADIYVKLGDYAEALRFYNKSLDIVPLRETSEIQFKIAQTRQAKGELDEAIEEYLKVTYLYSDNSDLTVKSLLRVASIYENKENFKEALNIYKRIAAMDAEEAKYARERMDWIRANIK